jgi:hypothetical protein
MGSIHNQTKKKNPMRKLIKTLSILAIITALGYTTLPILQIYKNKTDGLKSLESLKAISHALQTYQQDYGHLPPPSLWIKKTKPLTQKSFEDPTYKALTQTEQPNNPGWGMNTRPYLPIGLENPKNTTDPIPNQTLHTETILIGPSFSETLTPLTNGNIPPEALSARNPTPTDHRRRLGQIRNRPGLSGLYLFADHSIKQLNPSQSQDYLKLNTKRDPRKIPLKNSELKPLTDNPPFWINTPTTKNNQYEIQNQITSKLIPLNSPRIQTIQLRYQTKTPTNFEIKIRFYNQYKQTINTDPKHIDLLKSTYPGWGNITLSKSFPTRTTFGFNPHEGHLIDPFRNRTRYAVRPKLPENHPDKKIQSHYQRGTPIGIYKPTTLTLPVQSTTPSWRTKTVLTDSEIPQLAEFVEIQILIPKGKSITIEEPILKYKKDKKPTQKISLPETNKEDRLPNTKKTTNPTQSSPTKTKSPKPSKPQTQSLPKNREINTIPLSKTLENP